jgi:hypothetical protein
MAREVIQPLDKHFCHFYDSGMQKTLAHFPLQQMPLDEDQ